MKNKYFTLKNFIRHLTGILLFIGSAISAQSISSLEAKLNESNKQYLHETAVLDSLQQLMNKRAKLIDSEKEKPADNENNVKKLMAASVSLTNAVEKQQKKVNSLEVELEKIKHALGEKYSAAIDSLSAIAVSGRGNSDELKTQILRLTEKKILNAPRIYTLSYNPEKILSLNPSSAKTIKEKEIYYEYLNGALGEVEDKLQQVKNMYSEVRQTLALQKKTKKFLEEVEFSSDITATAFSAERKTGNGTEAFNNPDKAGVSAGGSSVNYFSQVQTYFNMLKQLDLKFSTDIKTQNRFSPGTRKSLSLLDYSELLEKVEKGLEEYKSVLKNKIGSGK